MQKKIAQFISYTLHPLILPTYLFALVFLNAPMYLKDQQHYLILIGLVFFVTFFTPAWTTYFLYKLNVISSMRLTDLKERRIPLLITAVLYIAGCYFFSSFPFADKNFSAFMYGITLNVIAVSIISRWWKISAHAVGIGGVLGILTYVNLSFYLFFFQWIFLLSIIVAGMVLWARLKLNAHTPSQVYVGFLLGFTTCLMPLFKL